MVKQTTFCEARSNSGKTGPGINKTKSADLKRVNKRPEILRTPQNLYLIAEARATRVALHDAVQEVDQILHTLEQAGTNGFPTCMIPSYSDRLCEKIDAGEAMLTKCQGKLDELVNIYSGYCTDTHQLRTDLSSCKEKFIGVKGRCQYFLPDNNLNIPTTPVVTLQPGRDPAEKSTFKHTESPAEDPAETSGSVGGISKHILRA